MNKTEFSRASTPLQIIRFKNDPETTYSKLLVTYSQGGKIVLEKTKDDMIFSTKTIGDETIYIGSYYLSQEETNMFAAGVPVNIQMRMLTPSGHSLPTIKKSVSVAEVLNDEVMENDI